MISSSGVVTTCIALAVLAGCAGSQDEPDGPPRALSEQERETISEAEGILTQRCMDREGYRIFLTEPPEQGEDLPYGRDDVDEAREQGLGLPANVTDEDREDSENGRYFDGLSGQEKDGYLEALNGDMDEVVSAQAPGGQTVSASTRGCTAEAQDELYGDFEDWFRTSTRAEALPQQFRTEVVEDERYREAEDSWSACMDQQGHDVESPTELRDMMIDSVDDQESKAAVAEARCGAEANLPEVGEQVEAEVLDGVDDKERRLVEHYRNLSHTALERAERVIADAGSESAGH